MSSFEDSDDDYAPIVATSWGEQAGENTQDATLSWNDLVDPNFKVGPNGLGGGNLHRQGSNYKPISEQYILNQRLKIPNPPKKKKGPAPGASRGFATRKPPSTRPPASTTYSRPPAQTRPSYPQTTTRAPPPSTTRPPPPGNSAWTSGNLVDVPFWEKGNDKPANGGNSGGNGWNNQRPDVPSTWDDQPQNGQRQQSSLNNKPDVPSSWGDAPQQPQRPSGMRPPPGLFKNAISQIGNGNAPNPPPGLAPVPTHQRPSQQRQSGQQSGIQQGSYPQQQQQPQRQSGYQQQQGYQQQGYQQQPSNYQQQQQQPSYQQQQPSYQQPQQQPSYQQPQQPSYQQSNYQQQQQIYHSQQPTNYQQQQQAYHSHHQTEPPTPAPTPPKKSSTNPVVITINMELEVNTIAVPLRLNDDPFKVAEEFSYQNGITDTNIIKSLRDIFFTQHKQAIQKRNVNSRRQ